MSGTPRLGKVVCVLATLALLAPGGSAQYRARFANIGSFSGASLNASEVEVSSSLPINGWSTSSKDKFQCGSWLATASTFTTVSLPETTVTYHSQRQAGCGSTPALSRVGTSIDVSDLEFSSTTGQTGSVSVTLQASLNLSIVTDPNMPSDFLGDAAVEWGSLLPLTGYKVSGVHDLTHTSLQPLDVVFPTFSIETKYRTNIRPPGTTSDISFVLSLGNPVTGQLFDLPPGITANAPSIGLVDNVLLNADDFAWKDEGGGLAGTLGLTPVVEGFGPLAANTINSMALSDALPNSTTNIILGFSASNVPFFGGVLGPSPDIVRFGFPVDVNGESTLSFTWPAGYAAGVDFYVQYWTGDPGAIAGYSASNVLHGVTH